MTDVALAPTGALVWRANDWCVCVSYGDAQARLQNKEWKGLGSSSPGAGDTDAAFATLVDGLSGCAWSYESETQ